MEQLNIRTRGWHQQTVLIAHTQTANNTNTSDRNVHDGNMACEFGLKDTVEVFRATNGYQAIGVCEFRKYTDFIAVLILTTCSVEREQKRDNEETVARNGEKEENNTIYIAREDTQQLTGGHVGLR